MESLLRRWKLIALKYKRESSTLMEKMTGILITMTQEEIRKLDLGKY